MVRERWNNHIDPRLKKGGWTETEDRIVLKLYQKMGTKWAEIARNLTGRNEN